MNSIRKILGIASLLALSNAMAEIENYKIDNAHSFANFSIRHVASKLSGTFSDVTGNLKIDRDNLADSSVDAKISLLSVNTSLAKRDEHIKKEEYLDVGHFADMQFVSTKVIASKNANEGVITGKLTLHGVTKELTFPFKVLGFANDPWGGYRTGIEAKTNLKASDFGFTWAAKAGGPVGDDLEVTLLIEGVKTN
jgi:polyisoprenoid-binding protein YceI